MAAFGQLIRLGVDPVRELAFGSISSSYMGVGSAFDKPIRLIVFQNFTDAGLMFSFDGINDHLPLPSNGYVVLDVTANKTRGEGYYIAEGTRIYVKEIGTPSSNSVYVTAFYGEE